MTNAEGFDQANVRTLHEAGERPDSVYFPFGLLSFDLNGVPPGGSATVSVYAPYNPSINSYWKQTAGGEWRNIASSIEHIGKVKTRVTFILTDGDEFDLDGMADGTIQDPGGPGVLSVPIPTLDFWAWLLMVFSFMALGGVGARQRRGVQQAKSTKLSG